MEKKAESTAWHPASPILFPVFPSNEIDTRSTKDLTMSLKKWQSQTMAGRGRQSVTVYTPLLYRRLFGKTLLPCR